mmetsp:Transcript_423/g.771  ORF Transcript_423/g.771 Transcript_423/m.771 type:complete len:927 (-) Transcript_423:1657-4437(-)|eukprot:CAMPEP_0182442942 /NCGR_PEP_ID=MMETSP1172-20130603/1796_1 /TAXON_ID=708627 /ORGANISM="Timspurckia oligopyrenoides, Strain CCMP3278" /LENGTH=926 /DNA_ID=CAMNT_0024638043 /DNA_START=161 /DNA_END=2941 /DNA_ORIENTATION=-
MPLKIDVKKKLNARSERVKCVDLHPTEPWVLASLYDGNVFIYNYESQSVVKSFEVTDQPIRAGKFIARKQWIVIGSDDMFIRVYNYNTTEKIKTFEAHLDYVRSLAVHPTLPYLLSSSDDMLIKLWDWEKGWANTMIFESHSHYVMQIVFNPKDSNTFASASLDHTVKVWNLSSPVPNFTLEGHEKGVNCVDYYSGGDKPYLVSGGDDGFVKIWDYQTKACVQTLEGHSHNVSCVAFLPDRPLILTGSEDGSVNLWHSNTYRLESTLNYGLDRCWTVSYLKGSNNIALGYDNGSVVIMLGKDQPVASIDGSGKVIVAKHNEILTVNVRTADATSLVDGERMQLPTKELGSCEVYPQQLKHSPNGRFVAVCGDGEFIIYTALAWRNKSYGQADELVWDNGGGEFATRIGSYDVRIFNKSFNERNTLKPAFPVEGLSGGSLIGLRGADFIAFYDWETLQPIRRIDVVSEAVYWSEDGALVAIASESSFFLLKFNRDAVDKALELFGGQLDPEGIEEAFELTHEIAEKIVTGLWIGDCFIYTNTSNRLNYCVGSEVSTLAHLDRPLYILGYLPKDNRLYLVDKSGSIVSYQLLLAVLEYKTAVVRGDLSVAESLLSKVPASEHNKIARFLDSQGLKERALDLATDADYRCELAISLGKLDLAASIARDNPTELKWRQLASLATSKGDFELATECMLECNDFSGLLTLYMSKGNRDGLIKLGEEAFAAGKMNIAFLCFFVTSQVEKCLKLLISTSRYAEAAFFARTYMPSEMSRTVELWKADLRKSNAIRISDSLANPDTHAHLFPDQSALIEAEKSAHSLYTERASLPSSTYLQHKEDVFKELSEILGTMSIATENGHSELPIVTDNSNDAFDHQDPPKVFQEELIAAEDAMETEGIESSIPAAFETEEFDSEIPAAFEQEIPKPRKAD